MAARSTFSVSTLADLAAHRSYLDAEWQALKAAPLSSRKARLVASLADAYHDRQFAAAPGDGDILQFRAKAAAKAPALGAVFALCNGTANLVTVNRQVPLDDYGTLGVEDFMVSLYNDHSVQRLDIALNDGTQLDALVVLEAAISALDGLTA